MSAFREVRLLVRDGSLLGTATLPRFSDENTPKVITWGVRTFMQKTPDEYVEAFGYCVPDNHMKFEPLVLEPVQANALEADAAGAGDT